MGLCARLFLEVWDHRVPEPELHLITSRHWSRVCVLRLLRNLPTSLNQHVHARPPGGSSPSLPVSVCGTGTTPSGERLFWAAWERVTSACLRKLVTAVRLGCDRDLPRSRPPVCQPLLSIRGVHLPYRVPALLLTMRCGAGLSYLLAIAYDYNVLGLGPDSP
jgi:hypothetical protein